MLMKLARLDDEKIQPEIAKCCSQNNAHYVPIIKNRFGILTDDLKMTHAADDSISEPSVNSKVFVNVYKCATDIIKKRKHLFWSDDSYSPYNGKILDNLFFKQVIAFCNQRNIFISFVKITSEYNTDDEIADIEEIQDLVIQKRDIIIEKMEIELKNKPIIFDRVGYVDIGSNIDFYQNNKDIILDILSAGFEE